MIKQKIIIYILFLLMILLPMLHIIPSKDSFFINAYTISL